MIPAVTVPGVSPLPCGPDAPCWIAGSGFRPVVQTTQACVLDDAPLAGKVPPGWMMTALSVDPWAGVAGTLPGALPASVLSARPGTFPLPLVGGHVPCCIEAEPFVPPPAPSPVPIEAGTAALLVGALVLLSLLRRRHG